MKKYLLSIPIILFPYIIFIGILCINSQYIMENVFDESGYFLIAGLFAFAVIPWAITIIMCIYYLIKKKKAIDVAKLNLIIKLCQIPGYIFNFLCGIVLIFSVWLFILIVLIIFLDCCAIAMTGIIGSTAAIRGYKEKAFQKPSAILYGICQFIFVIDIIFAYLIYKETRRIKEESLY